MTDRLSRMIAIEWARRMVADPLAVYLDTETTGIGDDAEIVDIAIIDGDGYTLLDQLVRPRRLIPIEVSRVHGIYAEDVADSPSWEEIAGAVGDILEGRRVVVYNADFDFRMIAIENADHSIPPPDCEWECAMLAYAAFAGKMVESQYRRGFCWHSLGQAAKAFGINPGMHRARSDAEACRLVVHAMAELERHPITVDVGGAASYIRTPSEWGRGER